MKSKGKDSDPVCGERRPVGHQVSDLVILTFSRRLQQPLPQIHEWHLEQTNKDHRNNPPALNHNQPRLASLHRRKNKNKVVN